MSRNAEDEYYALLKADAMEEAGATVVAVIPLSEETYPGARLPHRRMQIWARVGDDAHIAKIDEAIDRALEGK